MNPSPTGCRKACGQRCRGRRPRRPAGSHPTAWGAFLRAKPARKASPSGEVAERQRWPEGFPGLRVIARSWVTAEGCGRHICRPYRAVRLSKNSCRGEHCSPVPVCLVRKPSRKARCCAKLAGDQWSPLQGSDLKQGPSETRHLTEITSPSQTYRSSRPCR